METQNRKDPTFFRAASTTWLAILAFIIVVPLLAYLRSPMIANIGVLALLGLVFWAMGRRTREQLQHPQNEDAPRPGLRTVVPKPYDELKMDDEVARLNENRLP